MKFLLGAAASFAFLTTQAEDPPLRVGETFRGALEASPSGDAAPRVFDVVVGATESLTILLESFDFDAVLRVEGEGGEVLAEDDDGGVETNARVRLAAQAVARYRIMVSAKEGGSGDFGLSVVSGEAASPSGPELLDAEIAFRAKAADRALARGDAKAAGTHRLEEGAKRVSRSQFEKAGLAFEAALSLFRELRDRKGEAAALRGLGVVRQSLGEFAAALDCHERSLALARQLGDERAESAALGNLGIVHFYLGNYSKARECQERELLLSRDRGDRAGEATALGNLGNVYLALGDHARAREEYERHLALARELGDRAGEARAIANLGVVHHALGDFAGARDYHERHLALARELGDRSAEASALGSLGVVCSSAGDYARAREFHERHLALAREIGDRTAEARALGDLGDVLEFLGEIEEAREVDERHLALARELGDRFEEGRALVHFGDVHVSLGDLQTARARYEEALAIFREIGRRTGEMAVLGNLGNVASEIGDYAQARARYGEALELVRELGDRAAEATVLGNLAIVHRRLGEFRKALGYDERSLALAREIGDRGQEAEALASLGHAYDTLGNYLEACEYHERSLALAREIGALASEVRALDNLSRLYATLGNPAKARVLASAALAVYERMGIEHNTLYALHTLARLAIADRDAAEATTLLRRADRVLEHSLVDPAGSREATGWRSRWAPWGEIAQDLAAIRVAQAAGPAERAEAIADGFREAGRWKGRTLLEGIAENRSGARTTDAIRLRRERREVLLARDRSLQQVAKAIRDGSPASEVERLRAEAEAFASKASALAGAVANLSPRDASLDVPQGADPQLVRRTLGPKTALVEFAEGESQLYAYVLTDRDLAFLDLGDRSALRGDAEEYLSVLISLEPAVPPRQLAAMGTALFERLLAPALREAREGVERLVVVPAGSLAGLPFDALVMGGAGDRFADFEFVGDRYEVGYAPSSPVLVELAALGPHRGEDRVLVLADPLYASESDGDGLPSTALAMRAAPDTTRLPRLARTREEGLDLSSLLLGPEEEEIARSLSRFSRDRSGALSARRVDLFVGAEATPLRLRGDLGDYSILHLAGHGYVDREFPERAGIALSPGEGEGGYFTIADALDLVLDADLVVLSACETARGEVKAGEGLESLARAFLYAGAKGVVASLWQVEDRAALETMEGFYRRAIEEGFSPARALREAKLSVRRSPEKRSVWGDGGPGAVESGHPFFWAPFLYIGSPQ